MVHRYNMNIDLQVLMVPIMVSTDLVAVSLDTDGVCFDDIVSFHNPTTKNTHLLT